MRTERDATATEAAGPSPDPVLAPDAPEAPGQFALLGTRRFLPLFLVQFLGAFNDQTFQKAFVALLTYRLADRLDMPLPILAVIASALFILPFAIVTPTAGQFADRMDKARMMRVVKGLEVVVMTLAVVGFHSENVPVLYACVFLMGAQSAMFAPVKYGSLPQYLTRRELVGGNGLIQASTFVAILCGAIAGNELILSESGVVVVSATVIAVSVGGFVASFFAPPAPPKSAADRVDWLIPRAIIRLVGRCRRTPAAFRPMLFTAWFWFLGATFLSLLPVYARVALGADETVLTLLLVAFSVGVAAGALATERLSGKRIGFGFAPWAALGIGVVAIELWFATAAAPFPTDGLHDRAAFLSGVWGWRVLFDFTLVAAFAGAYVTPLNAVIQNAAPPNERGRFVACASVIDAIAMTISAGLVAVLAFAGFESEDILVTFSLSAVPAAWLARRAARRPLSPL